jgi:hypothetical protein
VAAGQSLLVQQRGMVMQVFDAKQNVVPEGQLHDPPGPEHVEVPGQSALVQHADCAMHWLKPVVVQTLPPFVHVQLPPGAVQLWPVTRQSLLLQHVLVGMHALLTVHTLSLAPHVHVPPGVGHDEPLMAEQSLLLQQFAFEMHALLATHA